MANSAPPWVMPSEFVVTVNGEPTTPPSNSTWFRTGQQTVTSAGNPVQLSTDPVPVKPGSKLTMIAKPGNSGVIYFAAIATECVPGTYFDGLLPGMAHSFAVTDAMDIWIDGSHDGDGVSFYAEGL